MGYSVRHPASRVDAVELNSRLAVGVGRFMVIEPRFSSSFCSVWHLACDCPMEIRGFLPMRAHRMDKILSCLLWRQDFILSNQQVENLLLQAGPLNMRCSFIEISPSTLELTVSNAESVRGWPGPKSRRCWPAQAGCRSAVSIERAEAWMAGANVRRWGPVSPEPRPTREGQVSTLGCSPQFHGCLSAFTCEASGSSRL